jgi:hypothetical protein
MSILVAIFYNVAPYILVDTNVSEIFIVTVVRVIALMMHAGSASKTSINV